MRLILTLCISLFTISIAFSQFGASIKYQTNSNKVWDDLTDSQIPVIHNSMEYGVNYWFRLKNQRIEFLPEMSYASGNGTFFTSSNPNSPVDGFRETIGFNFNTLIYPLDFNNDCNCPTFSKDGNFLTKGFYWMVSPGLAFSNIKTTYDINGIETIDKPGYKLLGKLGLGAGIDFGLGDIMTISPFVLYNVIFNHPWEILPEVLGSPDTEVYDTNSNISQLNFGLRLMFRPDYGKKKY